MSDPSHDVPTRTNAGGGGDDGGTHAESESLVAAAAAASTPAVRAPQGSASPLPPPPPPPPHHALPPLLATPPWLTRHGLWSPTPSPSLSHATPTRAPPPSPHPPQPHAAAAAAAPALPSSSRLTETPQRQAALLRTPTQAAQSPLPLPPPPTGAPHTRLVPESVAREEDRESHPDTAAQRADSAKRSTLDVQPRDAPSRVRTEGAHDELVLTVVDEVEDQPARGQSPAASADAPSSSLSPASSSSSSTTSPRGSPRPPADAHGRRCHTHAAAAQPSATSTAWVGCAHSDLPARCRDVPGYYCTYCSYTVCTDCVRWIGGTDGDDGDVEEEAPETRSPGEACGGCASRDKSTLSAATAPPPNEMDWLDELLAAPATAMRCGGGDGNARAGADAGASAGCEAVSAPLPFAGSSAAAAAAARQARSSRGGAAVVGRSPSDRGCHLCRRGQLVREEALLHEWCCEGPAPAARLHGGANLVYDTAVLQTYHYMRGQRQARLASTQPLIAQVLHAAPCALPVRAEALHSNTALVTQAPESRTVAAEAQPAAGVPRRRLRLPPPRDPMPAADGPRGRPAISFAASVRRSSATSAPAAQLDGCEEGGSFVFSVWNPRTEVQLVWCAVNLAAREDTPAFHQPPRELQHLMLPGTTPAVSSSAAPMAAMRMRNGHSRSGGGGGGGHATRGRHGDGAASGGRGAALPPSSTITPLFLWRCPPSLPGLPARAYRVQVPYGVYAFQDTHALALYVASDVFRKSSSQLTASVGGSTGGLASTSMAPSSSIASGYDSVHAPQLSSVKISPAATLRPLLVVRVLHHIASAPRPRLFVVPTLARPPSHPQPSPSPTRKRRRGGECSDVDDEVPDSPHHPHAKAGGSSSATHRAQAEVEDTEEVPWPGGLASPEFSLCIDHLLHGRSVAVYGIASKFFFLQHVAQSAALRRHVHIVSIDATLGRPRGVGGYADSAVTAAADGAVPASTATATPAKPALFAGAASASVLRQLVDLGHLLVRRVARRDGDAGDFSGHHEPERAGTSTARHGTHGAAASDAVLRAALPADATRSPAVARDVTAAVLRAQQEPALSSSAWSVPVPVSSTGSAATRALAVERHLPASLVDVVNVDETSTSCPAASSFDAADVEEGVARADVHDADVAGVPPTQLERRVSCQDAGGITPARGSVREVWRSPAAPSPSASPLSLMSPVPAFFAVLQQTVSGGLDDTHHGEGDDVDACGADDEADPRRVLLQEMHEFARPTLTALRPLPPIVVSQQEQQQRQPPTASLPDAAESAVDVTWCAPVIRFADDAVRRQVLRAVRRRDCRRRCVQWASLPSTSAVAVLSDQAAPSATPSLTAAHALRPGWRAPVVLVLHSVDLLDSEEAGLLVQLCAEFAFPHPQLQLLVSFDDPRWPLTPLAAALERVGLCAVQLRSLLLPRVHEMQSVNAVHLLTDWEAVASGGHGGLGGAAGALTSSAVSGSGGGGGGASHLLQDTMRRVLFSLPPAFGVLLRILIDTQEELGEGQRISLFVAHERFEQHGLMVTQGRQKALLQELTSNRIAQYDMAEHALVILQPRKLRKVLDEVSAQRDAAAVAAAARGGEGVVRL